MELQKKATEMLDGIRVDRRPTVLIEDKKAVDELIADIRRGKIKLEDVRLASSTQHNAGPKTTAALDKMVKYIVQNSRPSQKLMKKQRKTDRKVARPNWRR